jgi:methanogenic corrinoid protein MtbC1
MTLTGAVADGRGWRRRRFRSSPGEISRQAKWYESPRYGGDGAPQISTMVIGSSRAIFMTSARTVGMMMEGAGFDVVNLGINVDAETFIKAIHEHQPNILGMSALLTTTMPYMGVVIEALKEQNLRDRLIVLVGGAPLNEAFAEEIGADAYCRDAAIAVETAKKLVAIKRGQLA